ncbi:MAG: hypothetical protein ING50_15945 [Burkholderiales bacterium]|nr:hypothetical protein [Burkholderiales bacterium]
MRRHLTPILALAAAALLPACATPPATPVPAGAQRMEAKEIRTLFAYPTRLDAWLRPTGCSADAPWGGCPHAGPGATGTAMTHVARGGRADNHQRTTSVCRPCKGDGLSG